MEFLGLLLCTLLQCMKVPADKLAEVKDKINIALSHKNSKITLTELQSLIGSLNFLYRAVAPVRVFISLLSFLTSKLTHPWHKVRINKGAVHDLHMWLTFLQNYNGVSFFRDIEWTDNTQISLFSDASKWGFGLFFDGLIV